MAFFWDFKPVNGAPFLVGNVSLEAQNSLGEIGPFGRKPHDHRSWCFFCVFSRTEIYLSRNVSFDPSANFVGAPFLGCHMWST